MKTLLSFALSLSFLLSGALQAQAKDKTPKLSFPLDCKLGENCYVMHYIDRDPSPKAVDWGCGWQTYDGHQGTDFGLSDEKVLYKGVSVLAAADGTVKRLRDNIPDDRVITEADADETFGAECGNGIIIDHGDGWETQYCHLKNKSLKVKIGDKVKSGDLIAQVGVSGKTSFPHLHFSVMKAGIEVDPFAGPDAKELCDIKFRKPMWASDIAYEPTGVISAGFSDQALTIDDAWSGYFNGEAMPSTSGAMVAWIHLFGIAKGDVLKTKILNPKNDTFIEDETIFDNSMKSKLQFIGRSQEEALPAGKWKAYFEVFRKGKKVVDTMREIMVFEKK